MNNPLKVLIVEDEAVIALGMRMQLASGGFAVAEVVDNADDAFRQVEEWSPDIVLMDIQLRGKMDGLEAASLISSRYDLPVIFVTAHSSADRLERARRVGPAGYLVKPVSGETVKAAISKALQQSDGVSGGPVTEVCKKLSAIYSSYLPGKRYSAQTVPLLS
jgi:CheY-like chemotaxis protein